jgi:hypothetical protein
VGVTNKPGQPWKRQPREGEEAFAAFEVYRGLGSSRTLERVSLEHPRALPTLKVWSAKWDWVERCRAWDNFLQAERDRVAVAQARSWERRRLLALEQNWQLSKKLKSKVEEMLAFPVHRTKRAMDGGSVVVEPAKWTYQSLSLLARTAVEIEAGTLAAATRPVEELSVPELEALVYAAIDVDPARAVGVAPDGPPPDEGEDGPGAGPAAEGRP